MKNMKKARRLTAILLIGVLCIMSIQSEINRIAQGKASIVSAIEEMGVDVPESTKIDQLAQYITQIQGARSLATLNLSRLIIFGDSFTQGYTPDGNVTSWGNKLVSMLGDRVSQSNVYGEGGCGFSHSSASTGRTFLQAWNNHKSQISWRSQATTVIIMGGWNDGDQSYSNVINGFETFMNQVRSDCPDATIIYMFNPGLTVVDSNIVRACYRACDSGEIDNMIKIDSWWWMLLEKSVFSTDHVHPTADGHSMIAQCAFNALFGQEVTHVCDYDLTLNGGTAATLYIRNDMVRIYYSSNITGSRAIGCAYLDEWMFPSTSWGGPAIRYNDIVGLLSSGTSFSQPIVASFGGQSNGRSLYFIHIGSDLSTGSAFYNRTFDCLEFFG